MAVHCLLSDWESRENDYKSVIEDPGSWNKIPLINAVPNHELCDHQLVRFRGMIQQMFNPEFYLAEYKVQHAVSKVKETRSGRYRDFVQCSPDEELLENTNEALDERQVYYCITIPALNDWVQQQEKKESIQVAQCTKTSFNVSNAGAKRSAEDDDESMEVDHESGASSSSKQPGNKAKRLSNEMVQGNQSAPSSCPGINFNFPISGSPGMACIVKTYNSGNLPPLKLNDVVDVVGFLSLDPSLGHMSSVPALATDPENMATNPPPSIVPRLHAVALQKLAYVNALPSNIDEVYQSAKNVRKELQIVLSQMLLGDLLAADYLICHLISLVYLRKDGFALGHFSVNLSNLPQRPDYTRLLYSVLERIIPKSHYLPMTLENMNTLALTPKMDYEANRLSSGLLQLSDNTHLIVDETRLAAGKLETSGVANVQALRDLISHQNVTYDFQYYSKPYDADVPVLVLSEGKSLLPCNVFIPLKADPSCVNILPEIFQAANFFLRDPLLSSVRSYLSVMRHSSYEFPEDLQKKAQEDFVAMRQAEGQNVSADDLHLLLVLARLVSLSNGEKVVSLDAWEEAKRMEKERKQRVGIQQDNSGLLSNEL